MIGGQPIIEFDPLGYRLETYEESLLQLVSVRMDINEEQKQVESNSIEMESEEYKREHAEVESSSQGNKCQCKPRVLIVDDTEFNIIPVVKMLETHFKNTEVVEASNGKQAVDLYEECLKKPCNCIFRTFRVILMDLSMPVMNGDDASAHILNMMPVHPECLELTQIVAVTSHTNKKIKAKCLEVGMKEVYNKPLSLQALRQIMTNHYYRNMDPFEFEQLYLL